ncbi:sigma-70 family RNA polymerase sigma factor [bacterium LRH843]|nr:sigma-70 family RNA polymerase sigma factor [bacterium LRH843]
MKEKSKLVARAKKGDTDAFQALIRDEKEKLYKMAFVYVRNEEDALEVFQETVYQAFMSIKALKENDYFSTWLTRILINTAIGFLKKRNKVVSISQEIVEHIEHAGKEDLEDKLDLLEALDELEEKYKTVLLLRFYHDYTIFQISKLLNCPEGTVKTNIHRGLTHLRKKLKGVYEDDRKNSFI